MAEPTPGPWTNDNGLVCGRESRPRFADSPSVDIFDASDWPEELEAEAQANARLIAAAPDLLKALQEAQKYCSACGGSGVMNTYGGDEQEIGLSPGAADQDCTYCKGARAALAKATTP